jgi:HK97 family phage prohead protease
MLINFSSPIEAADSGRRIISGVVVPFGKVGNTSVGPVVFERGSIAIKDGTKIKLLAQHRQDDPIGRAQSFQTTDTAIYGQFKVSASQKGTDYLILCQENLIGGLSVGVEVIASKPSKDGTIYVSSAILKEVSLVESPAFTDAIVTEVFASETEGEEVSDVEETSEEVTTQPETESEAIVEETTTAAVTEAAAPAEASRPTIKASNPYISTTVRHGITSMGRYTEHKIKAQLGNEESKLWVAASEDPMVVQAAVDSIGTTNPAFNPIQYLREFVDNTNFGTPAIDAISKGTLPANGMSFSIPSLDTNGGGTAPTVASTAESGTPSNTGMVTDYITGTVSKYAGQNTVTLELLERSDPIFYDELTIQMQRSYLKAIDAAVIAGFIADGTAATSQTADSAGIIAYVAKESPLVYSGTSYFARNMVAGTGLWGALIGAVDSTGRPIYNAQPTTTGMNTAGISSPTSIRGNVLGLDLYVDNNAVSTLASNMAFIVAPEAATWYSSPTSYFSVNIVSNMQVQLAIYGYGSYLTKQAAGIRKFVKTA